MHNHPAGIICKKDHEVCSGLKTEGSIPVHHSSDSAGLPEPPFMIRTLCISKVSIHARLKIKRNLQQKCRTAFLFYTTDIT